MDYFTNQENSLIDSLNEPIKDIDMSLVNSIIDKMIDNKDYLNLIDFLNDLYDFADLPTNLVDRLVSGGKELVSAFLNNDQLYFLNENEKDKLKNFLNVKELLVRLTESYDFYYDMLFKQNFREYKAKVNYVNDNVIEHIFTKGNFYLNNFKLIETKDYGVVVFYVNYLNYNLSIEEQLFEDINYLNSFGFNIENGLEKLNLLNKSDIYK